MNEEGKKVGGFYNKIIPEELKMKFTKEEEDSIENAKNLLVRAIGKAASRLNKENNGNMLEFIYIDTSMTMQICCNIMMNQQMAASTMSKKAAEEIEKQKNAEGGAA